MADENENTPIPGKVLPNLSITFEEELNYDADSDDDDMLLLSDSDKEDGELRDDPRQKEGQATDASEPMEQEQVETVQSEAANSPCVPVSMDPSHDEPKTSSVKILRTGLSELKSHRQYENKDGNFITGLDLSSTGMNKKLEDRAKRFGLKEEERRRITSTEITELYESFDIDPEEDALSQSYHRLNAIHIRGINDMSTRDIMEYFGAFGPKAVEWINDASCNVVWEDKISAARAILDLSIPIKVQKPIKKKTKYVSPLNREEESEEEDKVEHSWKRTSSKIEEENELNDGTARKFFNKNTPVPPGIWRSGKNHPKAKSLFLRFACKDDKKISGAEKHSLYYKIHGNPNYGGLKGLISNSHKRRCKASLHRSKMEDYLEAPEKKSGELFDIHLPSVQSKPKMKMYADEEEAKLAKNKPSVFSRLGAKYSQTDLMQLGKPFSQESDNVEEEDTVYHCKIPEQFAASTKDDIKINLKKRLGKLSTSLPIKKQVSVHQRLGVKRQVASSSSEDDMESKGSYSGGDLRNKLRKIRQTKFE